MLSAINISTECVHRAIACNRGTGTADIHPTTDSIVFGGGQCGLVLHRSGCRYSLVHYLPLASAVTTAVWVKQDDREEAVLCCDNGDVMLWNVTDNTTISVCKHNNSAVCVAAISHKGTLYITSCGSDSVVKIHTVKSGEVSEFGNITIQREGFALCCTLFPLQDTLLLAFGSDDSTISLYSVEEYPVLLTTLTGHEDWVRGLDFRVSSEGGLLVSAAQDHYIRLWRIGRDVAREDHFKLKEKIFVVKGTQYRVTVESILLGHDNWVTSVKWMGNGMLLSASMDKTLIIWHQGSDGLWSESVHVGEVGGNNLGLFGALPTSDSTLIISHSFQGAFQAWSSSGSGGWVGVPMPGGHFSAVKDLSWAPSGNYLMTASTDQSVRVSAEWREGDWYEIARSQIHGHDMSCVHCISDNQYLSGSEEKVLRVFKATSTFFSNLSAITGCSVDVGSGDDHVVGALIPALGLSNKAITSEDMASNVSYEGTATIKDCDIPYQVAFAPADLTIPPVEEILLQNTLWPEVHKLYGHGYEVYQCTASPDNGLLATSCKASQQQFAAVILWRAGSWSKVAELSHHKLTVTRMKFSPDSQFLLTVSRDRDWAVWDVSSLQPSSECVLLPLATSPPKAHSRIIWDCAWFPGNHSFATVSRDKKLLVWDKVTNDNVDNICGDGGNSCNSGFVKAQWKLVCSRSFEVSVTAVDISIERLILLGFQSGDLKICIVSTENQVELLCELPGIQCTTQTINTVQWRPINSTEGRPVNSTEGTSPLHKKEQDTDLDLRSEEEIQFTLMSDTYKSREFAVCSEDGSVLVIRAKLFEGLEGM